MVTHLGRLIFYVGWKTLGIVTRKWHDIMRMMTLGICQVAKKTCG